MTKDAGSDIVLTRIFGRFAKDSSFFKKKYDITIGRDVDNGFTVCDSTLDYMHDFLQTRRDDLGDVIAHFGWQDAPMNRYKAGIAWDHDQEMMWVTTYSPNQIGLIDGSIHGIYPLE